MMELNNTIIYSSIAGLATIIGILIVLLAKEFSRKYSLYLISFSAGILISFGLITLIPESLELNKNSLLYVLFGFLLFYLLEHFIILHPYHEPSERQHSVGKIAILGLFFHSLIDGIIIAAGFEVSNKLGLVATLAVVAHELPEGITSMAILLHSKFKKSYAIIYSFLVAIATPIGALITLYFFNEINKEILGILISLAAGSFIYIGASDLLPETHEKYNKLNAFYLLAGILFVILINFIFK
jgi:ZIP family zinc transporter/zinc and cadmium transporter